MAEQSVSTGAGAALRSAREARGRSLRWLAAQLEIAPATLSALETSASPITVDRLARAAQVLGVPLARLATGRATQPSPRSAAADRVNGIGMDTPGDWREYAALDLGPILMAALQVFVEKGFHASTVRDVAAVAGLSVAGIYHHHPSKTDLLIDLFDMAMSEIRWRVAAARDEGGDDVERFAAMVQSLALVHAKRADLAFLGSSEMRALPPRERVRFAAQRSAVQHMLDEQAARAVAAAGDGREVDVEGLHATTRAIATMCTSLPAWFRLDGAMSAHEVARTYADLSVRMLGLEPASP